jgi:hypothetical protein
MPITVRRKQDADTFNYPEITSVTSAILAEDNVEACSSLIMSGGIQDGKEDEKRWKHKAKRQKQPQPKNIRFSKRIKRISLTPRAPIRRALFFIGQDGQKSVEAEEKCPNQDHDGQKAEKAKRKCPSSIT